MAKIKPEIWTRGNGEQLVVLSLRDFQKLEELAEDAGLSRILRAARRQNAGSPGYTLAQARQMLDAAGATRRKTRPVRRPRRKAG